MGAAFRFGHTLVQGMLDLVEEIHYDRKKTSSIPLSDTFFNPELVYVPGELDKFLVGLATQPRQKFDNIFTEQVTNHLFQPKNKSFGMDLVALNLQRGRDHGLPGYNAFRELCGLKRVTDFDYFNDFIPIKIVERLKLIFDQPSNALLVISSNDSNRETDSITTTVQTLENSQKNSWWKYENLTWLECTAIMEITSN